MTFSSIRQNLLIDAQGSNEGARPGGTPIERQITIRNRGTERADIELWVSPNDMKSERLIQWCTLVVQNGGTGTNLSPSLITDRAVGQTFEQGLSGIRISGVDPDSVCEVVLRIDVPPQAEPGFYSYDLLAKSPQYPGEQGQRIQRLRVLSLGQDTGLRDEPLWTIEPATSSDRPQPIKVGEVLQFMVSVQNRTDVVDRYHLKCPELDPQRFEIQIQYPELDPNAAGLITRTDGLMLNPGETGIITLLIQPRPHTLTEYTLTGYYSSTLRLTSFVRDNLVLLDIIYLHIELDDRLMINLQPQSHKIPPAAASFSLLLENPGNIPRDLDIQAQDAEQVFGYTLIPDHVLLLPGQPQQITLLPKPRKWWRRSWRGKEQLIDFQVAVSNAHAWQQEDDKLYWPALPEASTGQIVWQSRSPWIRRLLLWLLALLLLAGLVGLVYWLLREFVVKPSLEPKVLELSTVEPTYQAGIGNPIRLDWQISNPENLGRAIVTYYSSDGKVVQNTTFTQKELQPANNPICESGAHQPNMMLRLLRQLYGHNQNIDTLTCLGVSPQPTIANGSTSSPANSAALKPGTYQVKLELIPKTEIDRKPDSQSLRATDTERLKELRLTPPPAPLPPEILYFYSKTPIYRQPGSTPTETAANPSPKYPDSPIQLNWIIKNAKDITALELSYVNVTPDGSIQNNRIRYGVQNGIPAELAALCRLQEQQLICENVPTQTQVAGKYTFTLNVVMPAGRNTNRIAKDSAAIEIRPPLPQIQFFTVNGQDVLTNPQLVQTINPARGPLNIDLSWQVEDSQKMKIELLPAPGAIDPSETSMSYTLSPTPGNTTLTLQVTNQAGEMINRTVTIQTTAFVAPPSPTPASASPTPPPPPDIATPSSPVTPGGLPVFELPPRSN